MVSYQLGGESMYDIVADICPPTCFNTSTDYFPGISLLIAYSSLQWVHINALHEWTQLTKILLSTTKVFI